MSDDDDAISMESLDYVHDVGPPGNQRKLRDERTRSDIWNRRLKNQAGKHRTI